MGPLASPLRLGLSPLSLRLLSCPRWASPGQADLPPTGRTDPCPDAQGLGFFSGSDLRGSERGWVRLGSTSLLSCQCLCPG